MKIGKRLLLTLLILAIAVSAMPLMKTEAAEINTTSDLLYVGQSWNYSFLRIGEIKKVTYSNKKVAATTEMGSAILYIKAKAAGTTTITVTGTNYTYKIKLTVKKMDVTASFCKKLPDGTYLYKVKNNTKEGYFERVDFMIALRDSEGEFLDYDNDYITGLTPGSTVYSICTQKTDIDADLKRSTVELDGFTNDPPSTGFKNVNCTSKIKVTDSKSGVITPSDSEIKLNIKNNSSNSAFAYGQIIWYNESNEIVFINEASDEISSKKSAIWTKKVPEEEYGAVRYSITVCAFNKVKVE
jgi:hypothetical protein